MSPVKSSVNQGYQNDTATLWWRAATILHVVAGVAIMFGVWWLSQYIEKAEAMARPRLFVGLVHIEGLDRSSPSPPAFHLTLDAQVRISVSGCCNCNTIGGGNSMLRVTYHGMLLARGHVPTFCVCGGVANVEAKNDAVLLREEVRALIQSEQHVVGKAEFDVEGEVAGLGYLHCKAFLLQGNTAEGSKATCQVDYCH